jgi:hypothetical protein
MNTRLAWILGIAAGAVFFALAVWFWSIGSAAAEGLPAIRVTVRQPGVELKRRDTDGWRAIEGGTEIQPGDALRTDADGLAEVRWGDLGVTRLAAMSEMLVETLPSDMSDAAKASISLHLVSGRVWSRLLKLYGPEASFEARTDTVVATVRGTAFGLAKEGANTRLAVTESVVEARPAQGGSGAWIKEGKGVEFDGQGNASGVEDLLDDDPWVNGNRRLDDEFDAAFRAELEQRLKHRRVNAPEQLIRLSEELHLRLASTQEAKRLATAYTLRRAALAIEGGDAGCPSGSRICAALEKLALQGDHGRILTEVRSMLNIAPGSQEDGPRAWLISLRNRLLEMRSMAAERYARVLGIWEMQPGQAGGDERLRLLGLVRDLDGVVASTEGLTEPSREGLDKNIDGLFVMLEAEGYVALPVALESTDEPEGTASSTQDAAEPVAPKAETPATARQTSPIKPEKTNVAPSAPATADGRCLYSTLTLMAKPSSGIQIGSAVTLTLYGTCPDGKVDDLTAKATYNPGQTADGRVMGNVFYPARSGAISLYGNYFADGKTRIAQALVSVGGGSVRKLVGLVVTPLGPTTIASGQSSAIQAMAEYDDGTKTEVTQRCAWTSSDPKLADVFSGRVTVINGTGQVSITCGFGEAGVTVSDSQGYTVILDPSLMPSSGGAISPNQTYPMY